MFKAVLLIGKAAFLYVKYVKVMYTCVMLWRWHNSIFATLLLTKTLQSLS